MLLPPVFYNNIKQIIRPIAIDVIKVLKWTQMVSRIKKGGDSSFVHSIYTFFSMV